MKTQFVRHVLLVEDDYDSFAEESKAFERQLSLNAYATHSVTSTPFWKKGVTAD